MDHAPIRRVWQRRRIEYPLPLPVGTGGRPGCRSPSICPPNSASTPTIRWRRVKWARSAVSISTLDDMRQLFHNIPLAEVTTSMTINAPAMMLLALYILVAEEQGRSERQARLGTVQNDILKEYIARAGTYIYPAGAVDAARHRYVRLLRRAGPRVGTRFRSRAITSVRPGRRRRRKLRLRCRTLEPTCGRRSSTVWTSTPSRPACRSFSPAIATF